MLGYEVNKGVLDQKCAQTVVQLRSAFDAVETINTWLGNNPVVDSVDPLTVDPFGYTADEAYAVRVFFQNMDGVRTANTDNFAIGSKMTGLN